VWHHATTLARVCANGQWRIDCGVFKMHGDITPRGSYKFIILSYIIYTHTRWLFYHCTLIISKTELFSIFKFYAFLKLCNIFIFFTLIFNGENTIKFWFSNGNLYLKYHKILLRLFYLCILTLKLLFLI